MKCQTEKDKYCIISLLYEDCKNVQLVNVTKREMDSQIQRTDKWLWGWEGEEWEEGQDCSKRLRDTHYYVQI